jgi:hypothetical protein
MVPQPINDAGHGFATGDVLLFCGSHPLHRRQQEMSGCPWAQVALVVRLPGEGELVFEATRLSNCPDVRLGEVMAGVQQVRLSARVAAFDGAVAIRRLDPPLCPRRAARLVEFAGSVHGMPFNDSKWEAGRAWYRRNAASSGRGYFCSELVAAAYQHIGLVAPPPTGLSPNNYIPADFSSAFPRSILALEGAELGAEVVLKGTPDPERRPPVSGKPKTSPAVNPCEGECCAVIEKYSQ